MNDTQIHWFPGHMAVALRDIKKFIKVVDIIVEIIDARAPKSSRYPQSEELTSRKPTLILLNKVDLADPIITNKWIDYFTTLNKKAIAVNLNQIQDIKKIISQLRLISKTINQNKLAERNKNQPLKIMILGIPNVGKSTLINRLGKRRSTRVGDTPGVTKATQWIRIKDNFLILDTPGILPSNYATGTQAKHLALIGSIRLGKLDNEELGPYLYQLLQDKYTEVLINKYQLNQDGHLSYEDFLFQLAKRQGLLENNVPSRNRASHRFLKDYAQGKFGRISLETSN
jgi:ribosome biogenesis GTPase A